MSGEVKRTKCPKCKRKIIEPYELDKMLCEERDKHTAIQNGDIWDRTHILSFEYCMQCGHVLPDSMTAERQEE